MCILACSAMTSDYSQNSTKTSFSAVTISSKFSSVPTCTSFSSLISQLANRNRDNRIKHFIFSWIYGTQKLDYNLLMWINDQQWTCMFWYSGYHLCARRRKPVWKSDWLKLLSMFLFCSISRNNLSRFPSWKRVLLMLISVSLKSKVLRWEKKKLVVTKKFWWRWTTIRLNHILFVNCPCVTKYFPRLLS